MSYGSPGTALANISAISAKADQAHLELNIKDYEAMMTKKAALEGIKNERAKFDITRQGAELEAYLQKQKASADMLAGGIGNIVGATSYREWLRNMAENRKLTENIYNV
jgi:hypothetical protein